MRVRASIWQPRYTLTPAIARALMKIEAARAVVENMVLPPAVETELRHRARVRSTHYSTRIEGNRLTLTQAEQVVEGRKAHFHGRERDVSEVRNYWNALLRMEEHHARDLEAYYRSLAVHRHHNYYEGRAGADLTPWLEYFAVSVATVFQAVKVEALDRAQKGIPTEPDALRRLDRRARRVMALFAKQDRIITAEVAAVLGLSPRMARVLLQGWAKEGWLVVAQASNRARAYGLAESYRQFIGNLSAIVPQEKR